VEGKKGPRSEQEAFNDLAKLCVSRGYVHAIAYLCFRDNMIGYAWKKSTDMDALTKGMAKPRELSTLLRPEGARKVRSNDPCPCGSGKKYKRCCLLKK